jgi:hypothetical protein
MEDSKSLVRLPLEIILKILGYSDLETLYAVSLAFNALSQQVDGIIAKKIDSALKIVEEIINFEQSADDKRQALMDAAKSDALVVLASVHYDALYNYNLVLGQLSRQGIQEIAALHQEWIRSVIVDCHINFLKRLAAAFKSVDTIVLDTKQSDTNKRQAFKDSVKSDALVVLVLLYYEAIFSDKFSLVRLSSRREVQEIADLHKEAWVKQIIYQKAVYKALDNGSLDIALILKRTFGALPHPKLLEPFVYKALEKRDFNTVYCLKYEFKVLPDPKLLEPFVYKELAKKNFGRVRALKNDFGVLLDPKLLEPLVFEVLDKEDFEAELLDPTQGPLLSEALEESYTRTNRP